MQAIRAIARMVVRVLSMVGLVALFLLFLLFDFIARTDTDPRAAQPPRTVVVFTGSYDRIHLGLDMIATNAADELLISGANRTSGLIPEKFPMLFDPTPEQAQWVESGRITLAADAHSTFANALETACWLKARPQVTSVTLITQRSHMARASLALERAVGSVQVVRLVADPQEPYERYMIDLDEFTKFVITWFATLLPDRFWPDTPSGICDSSQR